MTLRTKMLCSFTIAGTLVVLLGPTAAATPLIVNGGFESGFSGWSRANQVGSEGTFALQTGTASPVNADVVPAPPGGVTAAMTDAAGPGSHVLYQDFVVPVAPGPTTLSFDLFIHNFAGAFFTPASLDFATPALNQQARVDILLGGTDPFSVAAGDVLQNVYQTAPGDAALSGYATTTLDLSALLAAHAGQTLRLRFAETDNVAIFQFGVDNVRLDATANDTVPEPASMLLLGTGLAVLTRVRRRR